MNVNRWRGQLGLTASTEAQLSAAAVPVTAPASKGVIFDLAAADGSRKILAAILPLPNDTYFFKLDGPTALVDSQREGFVKMVESAKLASPGSPAPSTPSASPPATPALDFTPPADWKSGKDGSTTGMRAASYVTGNGSEIAVLRFRTSPEAIVQNINIWRQEAGLPDATTEDELKFIELTSKSGDLHWKLHRVDDEKSSVLAGFATDGDLLWVVRLRAASDVIDAESDDFAAFLRSAKTK